MTTAFNSYNQTTESIDSYIRELEHRIDLCDYGQLEDSMLCDRLVCSIRDRLLQTPILTLEQCKDMCRLRENCHTQLSTNHDITSECVDVITRRPTVSANQSRHASVIPRARMWQDRRSQASQPHQHAPDAAIATHTANALPKANNVCSANDTVISKKYVCPIKPIMYL